MQHEPIARLTEQDFKRVRIDMLRDLTGFRRDEVLDETPAPMSGPQRSGVSTALMGAIAARS